MTDGYVTEFAEPARTGETDLEWLERQRVIMCSRGTPSADDLAAVRHFAEFLEQKAETERKLAAAREPSE